ncbi:hypothetical protein CERSUDRAFT_116957 [Gelatoporia subvermispora B]|uniref:Mid2 domain-containing protein n=1 Tax=Ceriporiopsis subvermispora (strain B) TaxID=914234 RepID=M2R8I7_CERS8|nr:hypothetical protein CERSUDRAFT_116957 [Gelatoporia subvermispora B]
MYLSLLRVRWTALAGSPGRSPSMATFNSTSLIVDDADPKITYSPGWALDNSGVTPGFNHTLHIANATGQWASFNFTGVSVAVYGDYGVNAFQFTLSSYAIDGTKVGTYQPPINMSIETSDLLANNVVFYQSPPLTQGTHVLNITINQAAPAGLFYLDYIVFTPGSPTSSQSQPTSSGSASTPVFSAVAPSSVTTVTATASPSSKSHVGAIVGGVIGGVVALVLIVVFGYYCYRRKMMRPSLDSKLEIEPAGFEHACQYGVASRAGLAKLPCERCVFGFPREVIYLQNQKTPWTHAIGDF